MTRRARDARVIAGALTVFLSALGLGVWLLLRTPPDDLVETERSLRESQGSALGEAAPREARRETEAGDLRNRARERIEVGDAERSAAVTGRVVDGLRGGPLEGATVRLLAADGRIAAEASTPPDGVFRLAVPPGTYRLMPRRDDLGSFPFLIEGLVAGEERDVGEVALRPTNAISGRVVDLKGMPLAGAEVALVTHEPVVRDGGIALVEAIRMLFEDAVPLHDVRTDERGSFSMSGIPAGDYLLRARAEGHEAGLSDPLRLRPFAAPRRVDFRLGRGGVVRGRVLDAAGAPVEGAVVAALRDTQDVPQSLLCAKATTDAEGRFVIEDLPVAKHSLFVEAPGLSTPPARSVVPDDGSLEVEIRLPRSSIIEGRVFEVATGVGLEGVSLSAVSFASPSLVEARSDASGNFVLDGVSNAETAVVLIDHPGWSVERAAAGWTSRTGGLIVDSEDLADGRARLEVGLLRGGVVAGRVVDGATGRGIAGVEVRATDPEARGFLMSVRRTAPPLARSDAEGRFEIPRVPPGLVLLAARHPDWVMEEGFLESFLSAPAASRLLSSGGRMEGIEIPMSATVAIRGRTVDSEGRPVPGAEVREISPPAAGARRFLEDPSRPRVFSGPDGTFAIRGAARREKIVLAADHPEFPGGGRLEFEPSSGASVEPVLELVLVRGGVVVGRIRSPEGPPAAGLRIALSAPAPPFESPGRDPSYEAETDAEGRFRFERIPPGVATLRAASSDWPGQIPEASRRIEVRAEETVEIDVALYRPTSISGRVLNARGEPLARAHLVLGAPDPETGQPLVRDRTRADREGAFSFKGLEPGSIWTVQVAPKPGRGEGGGHSGAVLDGVVAGASGLEIVTAEE